MCFCLHLFFVPTAFAKAEISWLRLSEVILSARLNDFFLCLISALGYTSVSACVCVCAFALPPETFCQPFVLIPVHQQTQTSTCYEKEPSNYLASALIPRCIQAS